MTRSRSLGTASLLALMAVPLSGIGCDDNERQFAEGSGGDAGSGATAAQGGDGTQSQGATDSGGSAGNAPTAGSAGGGADPGPNEGGSGGGGSGETDWTCAGEDLQDTASGTTADAGNDFSASCGSGSSPDVAYRFVAPAAGYYSFDTLGSSFDTVLSLFSSCTGRELSCNQDTAGLPQSEVVVSLEKDEEVLVVVDGSVGDQGQYSLKVEPVSCPALDLTGQPFPVDLSTVGQQDNFQASCADAVAAPERTMRWVPDSDGLYRFSVTTSAFQPALSVFEGAKCGGALLQCNTNVASGYPAEVTRRLEAGEPVTMIVDAATAESGPFTLNVEKLSDACPVLPVLTEDKAGVTIDDGAGTNLLSSSCEWAGNQYGGTNQPFEEHIYPINIPATGFTNCTYTIENMSGSWVAYLLRGSDCGGEELECISTFDGNVDASFSFSTEDAGDYLIVIENIEPFPGLSLTYDIRRACY